MENKTMSIKFRGEEPLCGLDFVYPINSSVIKDYVNITVMFMFELILALFSNKLYCYYFIFSLFLYLPQTVNNNITIIV